MFDNAEGRGRPGAAREAAPSVGLNPLVEAFRSGLRMPAEWGGWLAQGLDQIPAGMMQMALGTARQSASWMGGMLPWPESRLACQEFENKVQVFELFEDPLRALGLPAHSFSLGELLDRALQEDPFAALWIAEGLGQLEAQRSWPANSQPPRGLLCDPTLPGQGMAALHAGMGLCFACRALERVDAGGSQASLNATVEEFVGLCESNSRPGYLQAAVEPLGLAVRTLYPWLALGFDEATGKAGERWRACFWHGVGRGLYFVPTNFLPWPGYSDRALQLAEQEPPDALGRLNAASGLCWAVTLVNVRNPEVVEGFWRRHEGRLSAGRHFADGAASALIIWSHWIEGCSKGRAGEEPRRRWANLLGNSYRQAFEQCYPLLRRRDCLGELFRYQPLDLLAARIGNEGKEGDEPL